MMLRIGILGFGLLLSYQVSATDLTLLLGYQYNSDFEVADYDLDSSGDSEVGEPGDDVTLDGGAAVGVAMDFVFNQNPDQRIGFYLTHQRAEFDDEAGLDKNEMDITHLHFTAMSYYPNGNWEPFVLAGLGAAHYSPEDSTLKETTRFSAQIGGGTNYVLSDNLLLRFEARWIPTFFNGSSAGVCSGGCTIVLKSETYSQVQLNLGLMYRF